MLLFTAVNKRSWVIEVVDQITASVKLAVFRPSQNHKWLAARHALIGPQLFIYRVLMRSEIKNWSFINSCVTFLNKIGKGEKFFYMYTVLSEKNVNIMQFVKIKSYSHSILNIFTSNRTTMNIQTLYFHEYKM